MWKREAKKNFWGELHKQKDEIGDSWQMEVVHKWCDILSRQRLNFKDMNLEYQKNIKYGNIPFKSYNLGFEPLSLR